MKKIVLMITFFTLILSPCLADEITPLETQLKDHMQQMVSNHISNTGKELQLRAIGLYLMGEGLLYHKKNLQAQAKGKECIKLSEHLYQVGKELLRGKEVSVEDMEDWVNHWAEK